MLNSKKYIRIVFIILCALMILPVLFQGTKISAMNNIAKQVILIPTTDKLELLKLEQYKKLGIKTIEEFDAFWKNKVAKPSISISYIVLPILICIGCLFFSRIAYWCFFAYSLYRIYSALGWLFAKDSTHFNRIGSIYSLILFLICIVFIFIPKVKFHMIFSATEQGE